MEGLGQGPYARILIFLIPSVSHVSLTKTIPHPFVSSIALWHGGRKAASSECGGEVRRGEAWDGWRRDGYRRGEGKRKDGMPAQMTPREIKKGGPGSQSVSFTHGLSTLCVP